jgi:hypothetical protein
MTSKQQVKRPSLREALTELLARCREVKAALDADIPDDDPVHPQSAALIWPMSSAALALEGLPDEDLELKRLITAYVNAYKAEQWEHEITMFSELESIAREFERSPDKSIARRAEYFDIFPAIGCARCPWEIGDTYQRDCDFPDCSPRWKPAVEGITHADLGPVRSDGLPTDPGL